MLQTSANPTLKHYLHGARIFKERPYTSQDDVVVLLVDGQVRYRAMDHALVRHYD